MMFILFCISANLMQLLQEVDRKTALQLLSEGCGKQLVPNIAQSVHNFRSKVAQSVHDFRPKVAKVNDFKEFGIDGLHTKFDELSFNGIGKDSGYGDTRQATGNPWQV